MSAALDRDEFAEHVRRHREEDAATASRNDLSGLWDNPDLLPAHMLDCFAERPMRDTEQTTGRTFRTVNLAECVERGPQWAVQGLIEQGAVAAVSGEPGSGKSFLLVDLALHVAAGRDWFGRKVQPGAVLYVAAEASESVLRRAALVRRVKFDDIALPVKIITEPALLGDETYSAMDRAALETLMAFTSVEFGKPVALVIVDTIAASMGTGNENLDGMQRLVAAANALAAGAGASVVLNHHPNATGGTLRGHSSLRGTVSHALLIEAVGDLRTVSAWKQRDAEAGRLFAYRLAVHDLGQPDNFGDRATSCVIEPAEIPDDDHAGADDRQQTRLAVTIREVFTAKAPTGAPLRFGEIAEACRERCDFLSDKSPDACRKAISRAVRTLTDAAVLMRCELPRGSYRLAEGHRT
jgi:hypothetical protein